MTIVPEGGNEGINNDASSENQGLPNVGKNPKPLQTKSIPLAADPAAISASAPPAGAVPMAQNPAEQNTRSIPMAVDPTAPVVAPSGQPTPAAQPAASGQPTPAAQPAASGQRVETGVQGLEASIQYSPTTDKAQQSKKAAIDATLFPIKVEPISDYRDPSMQGQFNFGNSNKNKFETLFTERANSKDPNVPIVKPSGAAYESAKISELISRDQDLFLNSAPVPTKITPGFKTKVLQRTAENAYELSAPETPQTPAFDKSGKPVEYKQPTSPGIFDKGGLFESYQNAIKQRNSFIESVNKDLESANIPKIAEFPVIKEYENAVLSIREFGKKFYGTDDFSVIYEKYIQDAVKADAGPDKDVKSRKDILEPLFKTALTKDYDYKYSVNEYNNKLTEAVKTLESKGLLSDKSVKDKISEADRLINLKFFEQNEYISQIKSAAEKAEKLGVQLTSDDFKAIILSSLKRKNYKVWQDFGLVGKIDKSVPQNVSDFLMSEDYLNGTTDEKKFYLYQLWNRNENKLKEAGYKSRGDFFTAVQETVTPRLDARIIQAKAADLLVDKSFTERVKKAFPSENGIGEYSAIQKDIITYLSNIKQADIESPEASDLWSNIKYLNFSRAFAALSKEFNMIGDPRSLLPLSSITTAIGTSLESLNASYRSKLTNQKERGLNKSNKTTEQEEIAHEIVSMFDQFNIRREKDDAAAVTLMMPGFAADIFVGGEILSGIKYGMKAIPAVSKMLNAAKTSSITRALVSKFPGISAGSAKTVSGIVKGMVEQPVVVGGLAMTLGGMDDVNKRIVELTTANNYEVYSTEIGREIEVIEKSSGLSLEEVILKSVSNQFIEYFSEGLGGTVSSVTSPIARYLFKSQAGRKFLAKGILSDAWDALPDSMKSAFGSMMGFTKSIFSRGGWNGFPLEVVEEMWAKRLQSLSEGDPDWMYSQPVDAFLNEAYQFGKSLAPTTIGVGLAGGAVGLLDYGVKKLDTDTKAYEDFVSRLTEISPEDLFGTSGATPERDNILFEIDKLRSEGRTRLAENMQDLLAERENFEALSSSGSIPEKTFGEYLQKMREHGGKIKSIFNLLDNDEVMDAEDIRSELEAEGVYGTGNRDKLSDVFEYYDEYQSRGEETGFKRFVANNQKNFDRLIDELESPSSVYQLFDEEITRRASEIFMPQSKRELYRTAYERYTEQLEKIKEDYSVNGVDITSPNSAIVNSSYVTYEGSQASTNPVRILFQKFGSSYLVTALNQNGSQLNEDDKIEAIRNAVLNPNTPPLMVASMVRMLSNTRDTSISKDNASMLRSSIFDIMTQRFAGLNAANNTTEDLFSFLEVMKNLDKIDTLSNEQKNKIIDAINIFGMSNLNKASQSLDPQAFEDLKDIMKRIALYTTHNMNKFFSPDQMSKVLSFARKVNSRGFDFEDMQEEEGGAISDLSAQSRLTVVEKSLERIRNKRLKSTSTINAAAKKNPKIALVFEKIDDLVKNNKISKDAAYLIKSSIASSPFNLFDAKLNFVQKGAISAKYDQIKKTIIISGAAGLSPNSDQETVFIATFMEEYIHNLHHNYSLSLGNDSIRTNGDELSKYMRDLGINESDAVFELFNQNTFNPSVFWDIRSKKRTERTAEENKLYDSIVKYLQYFALLSKSPNIENINYRHDLYKDEIITTERLLEAYGRYSELRKQGYSNSHAAYFALFQWEYFARTVADQMIGRTAGVPLNGEAKTLTEKLLDFTSRNIKLRVLRDAISIGIMSVSEAGKSLNKTDLKVLSSMSRIHDVISAKEKRAKDYLDSALNRTTLISTIQASLHLPKDQKSNIIEQIIQSAEAALGASPNLDQTYYSIYVDGLIREASEGTPFEGESLSTIFSPISEGTVFSVINEPSLLSVIDDIGDPKLKKTVLDNYALAKDMLSKGFSPAEIFSKTNFAPSSYKEYGLTMNLVFPSSSSKYYILNNTRMGSGIRDLSVLLGSSIFDSEQSMQFLDALIESEKIRFDNNQYPTVPKDKFDETLFSFVTDIKDSTKLYDDYLRIRKSNPFVSYSDIKRDDFENFFGSRKIADFYKRNKLDHIRIFTHGAQPRSAGYYDKDLKSVNITISASKHIKSNMLQDIVLHHELEHHIQNQYSLQSFGETNVNAVAQYVYNVVKTTSDSGLTKNMVMRAYANLSNSYLGNVLRVTEDSIDLFFQMVNDKVIYEEKLFPTKKNNTFLDTVTFIHGNFLGKIDLASIPELESQYSRTMGETLARAAANIFVERNVMRSLDNTEFYADQRIGFFNIMRSNEFGRVMYFSKDLSYDSPDRMHPSSIGFINPSGSLVGSGANHTFSVTDNGNGRPMFTLNVNENIVPKTGSRFKGSRDYFDKSFFSNFEKNDKEKMYSISLDSPNFSVINNNRVISKDGIEISLRTDGIVSIKINGMTSFFESRKVPSESISTESVERELWSASYYGSNENIDYTGGADRYIVNSALSLMNAGPNAFNKELLVENINGKREYVEGSPFSYPEVPKDAFIIKKFPHGRNYKYRDILSSSVGMIEGQPDVFSVMDYDGRPKTFNRFNTKDLLNVYNFDLNLFEAYRGARKDGSFGFLRFGSITNEKLRKLYSRYIDSIFPKSSIFFHSTVVPFEEFDQNKATMSGKDLGKGLYLSSLDYVNYWSSYQEGSRGLIKNKLYADFLLRVLEKIYNGNVDGFSYGGGITSDIALYLSKNNPNKELEDFFRSENIDIQNIIKQKTGYNHSLLDLKLLKRFNIEPLVLPNILNKAETLPFLVNLENSIVVKDIYDFVNNKEGSEKYDVVIDKSGEQLIVRKNKDAIRLGGKVNMQGFKKFLESSDIFSIIGESAQLNKNVAYNPKVSMDMSSLTDSEETNLDREGAYKSLESNRDNITSLISNVFSSLGIELGEPTDKDTEEVYSPLSSEVDPFKFFKSKFGEKVAQKIRDNVVPMMRNPEVAYEFITSTFPNEFDYKEFFSNHFLFVGALYEEFLRKNNKEQADSYKDDTSLSAMLESAGYDLLDARTWNQVLQFKSDFRNGEFLCTFGDPGRPDRNIILWMRKKGFEDILPADEVTQEYLQSGSPGAKIWNDYLESKNFPKLKDGTFDLNSVSVLEIEEDKIVDKLRSLGYEVELDMADFSYMILEDEDLFDYDSAPEEVRNLADRLNELNEQKSDSTKPGLKPERQDPYGTSSMSLQYRKSDAKLSIKNRYNHTVSVPDDTFYSNLDNLYNGLDNAVRDFYNIPRSGAKVIDKPDHVYSIPGDKYIIARYESNGYLYGNSIVYDPVSETVTKQKAGETVILDGIEFNSRTKEIISIFDHGRISISQNTLVSVSVESMVFSKNKITIKNGAASLEIGYTNEDGGGITSINLSLKDVDSENISYEYSKLYEILLALNLEERYRSRLDYINGGAEVEYRDANGFGFNKLKNISISGIDFVPLDDINLSKLIQESIEILLGAVSANEMESIDLGDLSRLSWQQEHYFANVKNLSNFKADKLIQVGGKFYEGGIFFPQLESVKIISLPELKRIESYGAFGALIYAEKIDMNKLEVVGEDFMYNYEIIGDETVDLYFPNLIKYGKGSFANYNFASLKLDNIKYIGEDSFINSKDKILGNEKIEYSIGGSYVYRQFPRNAKHIYFPNLANRNERLKSFVDLQRFYINNNIETIDLRKLTIPVVLDNSIYNSLYKRTENNSIKLLDRSLNINTLINSLSELRSLKLGFSEEDYGGSFAEFIEKLESSTNLRYNDNTKELSLQERVISAEFYDPLTGEVFSPISSNSFISSLADSWFSSIRSKIGNDELPSKSELLSAIESFYEAYFSIELGISDSSAAQEKKQRKKVADRVIYLVFNEWKRLKIDNVIKGGVRITKAELMRISHMDVRSNTAAWERDINFIEKVASDSNYRNALENFTLAKLKFNSQIKKLRRVDVELANQLSRMSKVSPKNFDTDQLNDMAEMLKSNSFYTKDEMMSNAQRYIDAQVSREVDPVSLASTDLATDEEANDPDMELMRSYAGALISNIRNTSHRGMNSFQQRVLSNLININYGNMSRSQLSKFISHLNYVNTNGTINNAVFLYTNAQSVTNSVNQAMLNANASNIAFVNKKFRRGVLANFANGLLPFQLITAFKKDYDSIGNTSSLTMRDIVDLADGFSQTYNGVVSNLIWNPLDKANTSYMTNQAKASTILHQDLENLTQTQLDIIGIKGLLTQNYTFDISQGSKTEKLLLSMGINIPLGSKILTYNETDQDRIDAYNAVVSVINDHLINDIVLSLGENPDPSLVTDDQVKEAMRSIRVNGGQLTNQVLLAAEELKNTFGVSTVRDAVLAIADPNYTLSQEEQDYLDRGRMLFKDIADGNYSNGLTMKDAASMEGVEFDEINDYFPVIRYVEIEVENPVQMGGFYAKAQKNMYINNGFTFQRDYQVMYPIEINAFRAFQKRADQQIFFTNTVQELHRLKSVLESDLFDESKGGLSMQVRNRLSNDLNFYFNRSITKGHAEMIKAGRWRVINKVTNQTKAFQLGRSLASFKQMSTLIFAMGYMKGGISQKLSAVRKGFAMSLSSMLDSNSDAAKFLADNSIEVYTRTQAEFNIELSRNGGSMKGITDILRGLDEGKFKRRQNYLYTLAKNIFGFLPSWKGGTKDFVEEAFTGTEASVTMTLSFLLTIDKLAARAAFFSLMINNAEKTGYVFDPSNPSFSDEDLRMATEFVRSSQNSDNPLYFTGYQANSSDFYQTHVGNSPVTEFFARNFFAFKTYTMNEGKEIALAINSLSRGENMKESFSKIMYAFGSKLAYTYMDGTVKYLYASLAFSLLSSIDPDGGDDDFKEMMLEAEKYKNFFGLSIIIKSLIDFAVFDATKEAYKAGGKYLFDEFAAGKVDPLSRIHFGDPQTWEKRLNKVDEDLALSETFRQYDLTGFVPQMMQRFYNTSTGALEAGYAVIESKVTGQELRDPELERMRILLFIGELYSSARGAVPLLPDLMDIYRKNIRFTEKPTRLRDIQSLGERPIQGID